MSSGSECLPLITLFLTVISGHTVKENTTQEDYTAASSVAALSCHEEVCSGHEEGWDTCSHTHFPFVWDVILEELVLLMVLKLKMNYMLVFS